MLRQSDSNAGFLGDLVNDAWRFVFSHLEPILEAPLQIYASGLVFSPTKSAIRQLFEHEEPSWLIMKPRAEPSWSACVLRLERSEDFFRSTAISPDGKLLAHSGYGIVQILDVGWSRSARSIVLDVFAGKVIFAPNGESLAVALQTGAVELLDIKSVRRVWELIGHEKEVNALAFSPDGKLLASASPEKMVLWDPRTGHHLQTIDCKNQGSMSFSVDSHRLASGSYPSGEMRVWDVITGDCIWSIEAHAKDICSLAFLYQDILVSGSWDTTVKIWDLAERICTRILMTDSPRPSVVSLQDGIRFACSSGSVNERVQICNKWGVCLQTIITDSWSNITTFLSGPQLLVTASSRTLRLWDLASKSPGQVIQESDEILSQIALSCDGKYLASSSDDGTVRMWDTSSGTYKQTLEYVPMDESLLGVLTFSESRQLLISKWFRPENGLLVLIWDTAKGNCLRRYEGMHVDDEDASPSSDDQQPVFVSTDDAIMVHDLSPSNCVQKIESDIPKALQLIDVDHLIFGSDNAIKVWDILQSRCIAKLPSKLATFGFHFIAISADSNVFAVAEAESVKVWDLATQQLLHELQVRVESLAISSNNQWMVYREEDGTTIEILNLKTGTVLPGIPLPYQKHPRQWRFDTDNQFRLRTNCGVVDLANSLHGVGVGFDDAWHVPPNEPQYVGYGRSVDGIWILNGSARILWLPPEYRDEAVIMGSTVAIVHEHSRRVSVIRFAEDGEKED